MAGNCRKCNKVLGDGPGRPRVWCSVGCKRAAQREIRRIDSLLLKFEQGRWTDALNGHHSERRDQVIADMEARLKVLLDANGDDDE